MLIVTAWLASSLAIAAEIHVTVDAPVRIWIDGVVYHYLEDLRVVRAPGLAPGRHLVEARGLDGARHATGTYTLAKDDTLGLAFRGAELVVTQEAESGEAREEARLEGRASREARRSAEVALATPIVPVLSDAQFITVAAQASFASFDEQRVEAMLMLTDGFQLTTWQVAELMTTLPTPTARLQLATGLRPRVLDPQHWERLVPALDDRLLVSRLERSYASTSTKSLP